MGHCESIMPHAIKSRLLVFSRSPRPQRKGLLDKGPKPQESMISKTSLQHPRLKRCQTIVLGAFSIIRSLNGDCQLTLEIQCSTIDFLQIECPLQLRKQTFQRQKRV